jgi:hypothetical protein
MPALLRRRVVLARARTLGAAIRAGRSGAGENAWATLRAVGSERGSRSAVAMPRGQCVGVASHHSTGC